MIRNAKEDQEFLTFYGDTPYMVHWLAAEGVMSARLADTDYRGANPWNRKFDIEAVEDFGLDDWAAQIVATMHVEACGSRVRAA